jgi:hypothetical protein
MGSFYKIWAFRAIFFRRISKYGLLGPYFRVNMQNMGF